MFPSSFLLTPQVKLSLASSMDLGKSCKGGGEDGEEGDEDVPDFPWAGMTVTTVVKFQAVDVRSCVVVCFFFAYRTGR